MLVLFDIDGTLLRSQGAGVRAMELAAKSLFGEHVSLEGIEVAGRLDVLIWSDVARRHGFDAGSDNHRRFRSLYERTLRGLFEEGTRATLMPGVREIVDRVAGSPDLTAGLLTGNYRETGRLKIERAGLDPDRFVVAAWGDEGASRRDLPPLAMKRHEARSRCAVRPEQVVIIGDTPHDIDCARCHGCRSIGVATGQFSVDDLRDSGADLAVCDLADTAGILHWIHTGRNGE